MDYQPEKEVNIIKNLLTINDEEYNKTEGSSRDNQADEKQEDKYTSSWYAKRREEALN
jgi:hypothetical protein